MEKNELMEFSDKWMALKDNIEAPVGGSHAWANLGPQDVSWQEDSHKPTLCLEAPGKWVPL